MNKDLRFKNSGFTLVEVLIVIAILIILITILVGIIDPIALVNRANDSRRKKDLSKIKIAFEEYLNDKGRYPMMVEVQEWNISSNCEKSVSGMEKYLPSWPCGPNNVIYDITILDNNTFKATTNLNNKKDKDIPPGWYDNYPYSGYSNNQRQLVNYGVSSSNILWYGTDLGIDPECYGQDCLIKVGAICQTAISTGCSPPDLCFVGNCSGNNNGVAFPDIPTTPQCYIGSCCNGCNNN
jgi:prepilin-type N-terminal cleavage/methylation domain-containing protein